MQPRSNADNITDVLLYNPMHYFVVATTLGQLLVFKWDFKSQNFVETLATLKAADKEAGRSSETEKRETQTGSEKPQLMHTYKGHTRSVTSMKLIKSQQASFVSASLDGTIRIWCLDKFIQLHHFSTRGCAMGPRMTDI